MFVSDQEYLQSIGELQFLPQLDLMDGSASFLTGAYSPNFHGQAFSQRTGPTTGVFANGGRFWKTYTAYNNGNGTLDINPYELEYNGRRVTVLSGTGITKTMAPRTDETIRDLPLEPVNGEWEQYYNNIYDVIKNGKQQLVTHRQMRRCMRLIEAIFRSAETNQVVPFDEP